MNALQQLIRKRMDDLQIKSVSELARRSKMPRATAHAIVTTEVWGRLPDLLTLEKLARGLQVPVEDVQRAAFEVTGRRLEVTEVEVDGELRKRLTVIIKDLDEDDVEDLLAMAEAKQRRRDS